MKKIILFTVFGLFTSIVNAQIVTDELPYGLKDDSIRAKRQDIVVLSAPDRALIAREDSVTDSKPGAVRYAYPVNVNYTLENSGLWQTMEDSSKIWRLKVKLPEALSTNTYYDKFWLPEGAKFFVYSEVTQQYIGAITSEYIEGSREEPIAFATALIYGENTVFEYYQPASVKESALISISRIDYGYRYVNNPYTDTTQDLRASGSCQVNINCSEGANWQSEKNAAARVSVVSPGGSGWCSCALVNNTNNDFTPYVLTADHCLEGLDAISNNNASQWVFYWKYEYSGCNNSSVQPALRATTGATVKANNSTSDFALLLLTQNPYNLSGIIPYYLGWDRSGSAGTGGVGIHHPQGDVKKISTYSMTPVNSSCRNSNFWDVKFISTAHGHSVMEPGSSGSPLINSNHRIIGQLLGPYNCPSYQCDNPSLQQVAYGKFSVSWTGDGTTYNYRKLQPWLDPAGTNPQTLNGIPFYTIVGSDMIGCNEPETFSASQTLPSYNWSVTSPLLIVSGQGTSSIYVGVSGVSAPATATITLNGNVTKQVNVGLPTILGIEGPSYVKVNTPNTYTTRPNFTYSVGECLWCLDSYPCYSSEGGTATLTFTETGTYVLTATPWGCYQGDPSPGLTIYISYSYNVIQSTDKQISVTPIIDNTESNDDAVLQADSTEMIEYTLTDKSTAIAVDKGQMPAAGGTLNFAHVPAGTYIFRIIINDSTFEEHNIVL
ncbi:MAG: serine protease [Prevotellaceae bacterium]|jgi:hypothetical protein|nr:serine protease [Prevotellaceae bacterium]